MQHILFIGADFEQYLRLKTILNDFTCVYSVNLTDGIRQFNQQQFSLIVLDLSLILSNADQEELLRSFRRAHLHTPDQQLHLHGILAPPCRKGAPLHKSKERDLYNWRSTGNCDYINWRSHHAKLSGDLETG